MFVFYLPDSGSDKQPGALRELRRRHYGHSEQKPAPHSCQAGLLSCSCQWSVSASKPKNESQKWDSAHRKILRGDKNLSISLFLLSPWLSFPRLKELMGKHRNGNDNPDGHWATRRVRQQISVLAAPASRALTHTPSRAGSYPQGCGLT